VTNTGSVVIRDITIQDDLVPVEGGPVTLAPGESDSDSFTAVYTLTAEDIDRGYVENQALAVGYAPDGSEVTDYSDDPFDTTDSDSEDDQEPDDPTTLELIRIKVNTLFTPNGDGVNDKWVVEGIDMLGNRVATVGVTWYTGPIITETIGTEWPM